MSLLNTRCVVFSDIFAVQSLATMDMKFPVDTAQQLPATVSWGLGSSVRCSCIPRTSLSQVSVDGSTIHFFRVSINIFATTISHQVYSFQIALTASPFVWETRIMSGTYSTTTSRSRHRFNLLYVQIKRMRDWWHKYLRRYAGGNTVCGCEHDMATVLCCAHNGMPPRALPR